MSGEGLGRLCAHSGLCAWLWSLSKLATLGFLPPCLEADLGHRADGRGPSSDAADLGAGERLTFGPPGWDVLEILIGCSMLFLDPYCASRLSPQIDHTDKQPLVRELPKNGDVPKVSATSNWQRWCRRQARFQPKKSCCFASRVPPATARGDSGEDHGSKRSVFEKTDQGVNYCRDRQRSRWLKL
jgi:hypothetical protein